MMKQPIHYIIILWSIISGVLSACSTQEDFLGNDQPESQQIHIAYRVMDNEIQTRADTENGETNLNENKITRLDLFIANGNSLLHFYSTKTVDDATSEQTFTPDEGTGTLPATITANTTFYLVANCSDVANITTLEDLKARTISFDEKYPFNAKQETFVMDGLYTVTDADVVTEDITITIDLSRALAKIRFTFEGEITPTSYQFFNYATTTHVLTEAETYKNELESMDNFATVTDDPPLTSEDKNNVNEYIFYSYPNDWYNDQLKVILVDDDDDNLRRDSEGRVIDEEGNLLYEYDAEGLHNNEPIIPDKQTYLMVRATYDNVEGYYKIPVNARLPQNSDQPYFTEQELDDIHHYYYRLNRNHLYDITVTIDGQGGPITDPVTPKYSIKINDWIHGNDYILDPDAFQ